MKKETWVQILLAAIGFISGYFLNPALTRQLETDKLTYEKRIEGYMLYSESLALQRKREFLLDICKKEPSRNDCPKPEDTDDLIYEAWQQGKDKFTQARLSIALLSDGDVARSLARYAENALNKKGICNNEIYGDIAVYQSMRNEMKRGYEKIDDATMAMVIHGCKLLPKQE